MIGVIRGYHDGSKEDWTSIDRKGDDGVGGVDRDAEGRGDGQGEDMADEVAEEFAVEGDAQRPKRRERESQ